MLQSLSGVLPHHAASFSTRHLHQCHHSLFFSWNEFLFALTFTSTERSRTIPVAIALFSGVHEVPWGDIAAAMVVTVPLVFLVFFFQGRIIEGLTAGAVKG